MAEGAVDFDRDAYTSLLGLAEHFRTSQPPQLRECIHCLQACLSIGLPPILDAKIRLSLAKLLLQHTNNVGHARSHLQQAVDQPEAEEVFFESASLLAKMSGEQNQSTLSKNILRSALEKSAKSRLRLWHYRMIFQLAEIHAHDKEFNVAIDLLSALGETTAQQSGHMYAQLLFTLSKSMLLLATRDFSKFEHMVPQINALTMAFTTNSVIRRETIKVFWSCLKTYYFLLLGKPKTGKDDLKHLQQGIQYLTAAPDEQISPDDPEALQWMSKDQICVLVYLVTVMHSMHSGCLEKALKYTDKALGQIERIRAAGQTNNIVVIFQLSLMEHAIMCKIVTGQGSSAIQEISKACRLCQQDAKITANYKPVLHCLLVTVELKRKYVSNIEAKQGLYAMSMNLMNDAREHFRRSIQKLMECYDIHLLDRADSAAEYDIQSVVQIDADVAKSSISVDLHYRIECQIAGRNNEVGTLAALNLAIVYARGGEPYRNELIQLLQQLNNHTVAKSQSFQAGYFYVRGLTTFFQGNYHDAKKYLRETLRLGNAEDLNRLTACSLVLLGHAVTCLGQPHEALNMVMPAMQLASKIPDVYLQLWAASLLKDMYRLMGDEAREAEGAQLHHLYTTQLLQDHFQAGQRPEHALLKETS